MQPWTLGVTAAVAAAVIVLLIARLLSGVEGFRDGESSVAEQFLLGQVGCLFVILSSPIALCIAVLALIGLSIVRVMAIVKRVQEEGGGDFFQYLSSNLVDLGPSEEFLRVLGFTLAFMLAVPCVLLVLARWRAIRAFVSYSHEDEDHATRLEAGLRQRGLSVRRLEFTAREHDALLEEVREGLRWADVLVAIPGSDRSFAEAEVLAASVSGKPVVLVAQHPTVSLPNTALSGYPVFDFERVEKAQWRPLARFANFATNHWSEALRLPLRAAFKSLHMRNAYSYVVYWSAIATTIAEILADATSSSTKAVVETMRPIVALYGITFACLLSIGLILAVAGQIRARRVAVQSILTASYALAELEPSLSSLPGDLAILECLREPLEPRSTLLADDPTPGSSG